METEKPKRQLTPEQLENLKKGREKARLSFIQKKEINDVSKQQKLEAKKQREAKQEEAYKAVLELKKGKEEPKEAPKAKPQPPPQEESEEEEAPKPTPKPKAKPTPKPTPQPQEESENEEEEEEYERPPRKMNIKQPVPPPKQFIRKQRPPPTKREPSDAELYENANIELLRKRFYQQTKQRLMNDLFNY